MGRPYTCPYCGVMGESLAKGFRYNKSGKVRLRRCKSCGRRWTIEGSLISADDVSPSDATSGAEAPDQPEAETQSSEEAGLPPPPAEESSRYGADGSPSQNDPGGEREEENKEAVKQPEGS